MNQIQSKYLTNQISPKIYLWSRFFFTVFPFKFTVFFLLRYIYHFWQPALLLFKLIIFY